MNTNRTLAQEVTDPELDANGNRRVMPAAQAYQYFVAYRREKQLPRVMHNVQCYILDALQGNDGATPATQVDLGPKLGDEDRGILTMVEEELTKLGYTVDWQAATGISRMRFNISWDGVVATPALSPSAKCGACPSCSCGDKGYF